MTPLTTLLTLLTLLPLTLAQFALPLSSTSRWIVDANGHRVKLRCANWAAHLETNLPEGLHRQPLSNIISFLSTSGFNCVRLTYSTDLALSPALTFNATFPLAVTSASLPPAALDPIRTAILAHNPWITPSTPVLSILGTLIDALHAANILTLLDNHVSKASWCCDLSDGNGWFDAAFPRVPAVSRYFHTQNWIAGLRAMAAWSRASHPGVVGFGLRNELRAIPGLDLLNARGDWYKWMQAAGDAVHAAHPEALVVVGGANGGTDLTHLRMGRALDTAGAGGWEGKKVWEMHAYSFTVNFPDLDLGAGSCEVMKLQYGAWSGFVLEQGRSWTGPLWVSEFGVGMTGGREEDGGLGEKDRKYLGCLREWLEENDADWGVWALGGSYYVRQGRVDDDEGFGLLDYEWKGWRNERFKGMLGGMWNVTQGPGV
ncbi:glycoside hydrolase family 5 protein [Schizothecium vesticola]|uniref:Glycoside hydrolase family 5 protein n=1 Tax=Schizothecium vesticola TaxID=314040 RepID=A0AA40F8D1_9PEZI|nr:glycoside hydrolase family 5 protein [Schizothecium vesticola]